MTETSEAVEVHGTGAAWNRHNRRNEKPCDLCAAGHAGYITAYRQRLKLRKKPAAHGTERGLITHWAWDDRPCALCEAWQREYMHGLTLERLR